MIDREWAFPPLWTSKAGPFSRQATRSTTLRLWNPAHFTWSTVRRASRIAAEPLQTVADPVAAALEAVLALRRSGADPKVMSRALRRIEELLDE